jgi:hypothetical protein
VSVPFKSSAQSTAFVFGLSSGKNKPLVAQASELLSSLKRKPAVSPVSRIPSAIHVSKPAVKLTYPILFKRPLQSKPSSSVAKR